MRRWLAREARGQRVRVRYRDLIIGYRREAKRRRLAYAIGSMYVGRTALDELVTWFLDRDRFAHISDAARALGHSLSSGTSAEAARATRLIGSPVAYALCAIFPEEPATSPYWVDDVIVRDVSSLNGRDVLLHAFAWCGDQRAQWRVPAQVVLLFSSEEAGALRSLIVRIGDRSKTSLSSHRSTDRVDEPREWLHEYELVPTPPDELPDPANLISCLDQWIEANPSRPVLDAEWQYRGRDAAVEDIRERLARGEIVILEETWLDGGPALRCASSPVPGSRPTSR
jgi:hypothetical protein